MATGEEKIYCNHVVYLKRLLVEDISEAYVKWMNQYEIVKYTEGRHSKHSYESIKTFVESVINDTSYCYGIFDNETDTHVGNVKIGNINSIYHYADLGIIIGNSQYWGRGIASEVIKTVIKIAFETLSLHRLYAGIYANNKGSIKAFEKAGFYLEGREYKKYFFEGEWIDGLLYGIVNEK